MGIVMNPRNSAGLGRHFLKRNRGLPGSECMLEGPVDQAYQRQAYEQRKECGLSFHVLWSAYGAWHRTTLLPGIPERCWRCLVLSLSDAPLFQLVDYAHLVLSSGRILEPGIQQRELIMNLGLIRIQPGGELELLLGARIILELQISGAESNMSDRI